MLWPHGVLFRDTEQVFREKMIKDDIIEAVIGLGSNLFYNSPMEACLLICRYDKPKEHKGKVIFINAVNEVARQNAFSYLEEIHINNIYSAYKNFKNRDGFACIIDNEKILKNNANLNIALYISNSGTNNNKEDFSEIFSDWLKKGELFKNSTDELYKIFKKEII